MERQDGILITQGESFIINCMPFGQGVMEVNLNFFQIPKLSEEYIQGGMLQRL